MSEWRMAVAAGLVLVAAVCGETQVGQTMTLEAPITENLTIIGGGYICVDGETGAIKDGKCLDGQFTPSPMPSVGPQYNLRAQTAMACFEGGMLVTCPGQESRETLELRRLAVELDGIQADIAKIKAKLEAIDGILDGLEKSNRKLSEALALIEADLKDAGWLR